MTTHWPRGRATPPALHAPTLADLGRLPGALAAVAATIALAAVLGWTFDVERLEHLGEGSAEMQSTAALALLALATSWLPVRRVQLVATAFAAVIAGVTLAGYAVSSTSGLDELFFAEQSGGAGRPGRMATATALCLVLIASARLAVLCARPRVGQALGLLSITVAAVATFGYLFDVRDLYATGPTDVIAPNTAMALLLLSTAVLASVPGGVLTWTVRGTGPGPLLLRRLLPVAFGGLPVLGGIALTGERAGWWGTHHALALVVVGSTVLVASFAWDAARELSGVDGRRLSAIADLRCLADELEDRVEQRVAQVEAHNARIAVLEDRERIASDLHDLVVQQLFAAGMQLQGVAGLPDRADVARRVDAAVDAIDSAIVDLRASIYRLGGGLPESDLQARARQVVDGAAMGLGFRPTLTFDGPVAEASQASDDLLAVLREALSNVARHAHATRTDVRLSVTPDEVVLTIADDGIGVGRVDRASGTRHMSERAARLGGTSTLRTGRPQGTVVEWRVPRDADGRLQPATAGAAARV